VTDLDVPGLRVRRPRLDDVEAVFALVTACDVAVLGRTDATAAQIEADLAVPGYDRERGGLLVEDGAGAVTGWLWTEDDAEAGKVFVDPYSLDPLVLAWLVEGGIEYTRRLAAERGRPLELAAGSWEQDGMLGAAFDGAGLEVCRRFWRMRVDLAGASWPPPELPPGVTVRTPDPEQEASYRLLYRIAESSFAEHWGHADRSYEGWRTRFEAGPGRDPAQWWVAEVDGEPAAVLIGDDSRVDLGMGWVRTLGVLAAFRGRGLGKALLRTSFAAASARGLASVGLAVDSENASGATKLYESVGMYADSVQLAWKGTVGG
jgi:ribosomal protein S18 acetylase RimI-like enzyme